MRMKKTILQGEYRLITKKTEHVIDASINNENYIFSEDNQSNSHFSQIQQ